MQIKLEKMDDRARVPARATNYAVGYDCFALWVHDLKTKEIVPLPYQIMPEDMVKIGTGIKMELPLEIECQVRPRSGLVQDFQLNVANSPGTLDPDYRGELCVLLINHGDKPFVVKEGMRIAQLIFAPTEQPVFEVVTKLPDSIRSDGGFGFTGMFEFSEGTTMYEHLVHQQDIFYMNMAISASLRSGCVRDCLKGPDGQFQRDEKGRLINQTHRFGCVIVKDDNAVSSGFNCPALGQPPCVKVGCQREAEKIPSGTQIEQGRCIHAEWMAITKMLKSGVGCSTDGATMYVTAEPCLICAKIIACLGLKDLVVLEGNYSNNGIKIVKAAGVDVRFVKKSDL